MFGAGIPRPGVGYPSERVGPEEGVGVDPPRHQAVVLIRSVVLVRTAI